MSLEDNTDDELSLFKQAVADARPIKVNRVIHPVKNQNQFQGNFNVTNAKRLSIH